MKVLMLGDNDLIGRRFNGYDLRHWLARAGISSRQLVMEKHSDDPDVAEYAARAPAESFTKNLFLNPLFIGAGVCHCHLMHNTPFDFNYLPLLTRLKPFVFSVHDPWLLSGHCVHHFDCDKWQNGCYDCGNLDVDFRIPLDLTCLNWRLKRDAYGNSDFALVVTSRWMEEKVMLSDLLREKRRYRIPFGIDQDFFSPGNKAEIRARMGIPEGQCVIMTLDQPDSPWKGGDIKVRALKRLCGRDDVSLITVGRLPHYRRTLDFPRHWEYGWVDDETLLRDLYRAADVFLMPSRVETFGMMAMEAMSCGAVVLTIPGTAVEDVVNAPECGVSVREQDYPEALVSLVGHPGELALRSRASRAFSKRNYDIRDHVARMKAVYEEELDRFKRKPEDEFLLSQLGEHAII